MAGTIKVNLRPRERIYINGAAIRVDRKVTLELENETSFLLGCHVLDEAAATTPLKCHYRLVQAMMMEPAGEAPARALIDTSHRLLAAIYDHPEIAVGLDIARAALGAGRGFEALKALRALFAIEHALLAGGAANQGASIGVTLADFADPTAIAAQVTGSEAPRVPSTCHRSRRPRRA